MNQNQIQKNNVTDVVTLLPSNQKMPTIHKSAAIRNSVIIGDVVVDSDAHIVNAVIRADEGAPFYIGKGSNVQDFCVLHGYLTKKNINLIEFEGKSYSIYISENVSISHGALIHGPSFIGKNTFIGFKSTVDAANVGRNVEIGAHSYIKGVNIPDNVAIAPNSVILDESDIENYLIEHVDINKKIIAVNLEMAKTYNNSI